MPTSMLTGNSSTVKLWEKKTWVQAMHKTYLGHFFNRGAIYYPKEVSGGRKGDTITFDYVGKLTSVPRGEGQTVIGNAESLETTAHSMSWNVSRVAVESPNDDTIEQQRTNINFDMTAVEQIKNRAAELLDTSMFMQLAGAAPTSYTVDGTTYASAAELLHIQGHNTPIAPSTNRIVRAGGAANDQSLTSANLFTTDLIDVAMELADTTVQPVQAFDDGTYDLVLHPNQVVDLKRDSSGKIQWYGINLAALTGGKDERLTSRYKNGLVCLGKYNDVWIWSSKHVAQGVSSADSSAISTVRRAVLVGKDALSFASPFGGGRVKDTTPPMKLKTELRDVEYYKVNEGRLIYGMKKMIPTGKEDIGVVTISTYATTHTS